jgi:hypothetical protein
MSKESIPLKQYLINFKAGMYAPTDTQTQIKAGWYDWFCRDTSLAKKTIALTNRLLSILPSYKINLDTMYVFFKNNCPMSGPLYDDFRVCDMTSGDVLYTVTPRSSHSLKAEVWGRENSFKEPIVIGTWKDVVKFFKEV